MLIIALEGGLVSSITTDDPTLIGKEVLVLDYDDGCMVDAEERIEIKFSDSDNLKAFVHTDEIYRTEIQNLKEIVEQAD